MLYLSPLDYLIPVLNEVKMRLLRVRVPNFRALKNVDLTFEKDFTPQIFPLGSLNGGGKSTLLQLIFILLNLVGKKYPKQYLDYTKNILNYITLSEFGYAELATLDIWDGEKTVEIKYICKTIKNVVGELNLSPFIPFIDSIEFKEYLQKNQLYYIAPFRFSNQFCDSVESDYYGNTDNRLLFCHSPIIERGNRGDEGIINFLFSQIHKRIYLAAPSSQMYLFLSPEERKSLFKVNGNYNDALEKAKKSLPGFFTYDTFSVATLSSFFRTAWDKDIDEKVKTGKYGDNYSQMLYDINQVIAGKTIVPQLMNTSQGSRPLEKDLIDSIMFKSADGTELYPEDLSHGELKKLSIYAWLKANQIKNSIVLMDEIENGFHPDWQFEIVRELEKWEPSNQYILATHSYSLCTALTPSHVKELEPKLIAN